MCKGTSKSSIHQEKMLFSLPEMVSDKIIRVDFDSPDISSNGGLVTSHWELGMTAAMTQVPTAILIVAKTSKAFLPSLESSLTKRMSTLFALQYSIACCNMGRSTFFFAPEKGAMVPDPIAPPN